MIETTEKLSAGLEFKGLRQELGEQSHITREMIHPPHRSLLTVEKQGEYGEKLLISFHPCLRITNCLPVPLSISLDNSIDPNPVIVLPQKQHQDLSVDLPKRLSVKIPGFEVSKPFPLIKNQDLEAGMPVALSLKPGNSEVLNEEDATIFLVQSKTCRGKITQQEESKGSQQEGNKTQKITTRERNKSSKDGTCLFIYAKTCLINTTYQMLDFWAVEKGGGKRTRVRSCKSEEEEEYGGNISLLGCQERIMIGLRGFSLETTNEVDVKETGDCAVELKSLQGDRCQLYEFGVSVKLKKASKLTYIHCYYKLR